MLVTVSGLNLYSFETQLTQYWPVSEFQFFVLFVTYLLAVVKDHAQG